jgi:hypothetical protein
MRQQTRNIIRSFLYGLTGAGLFRRLDYPGAPKYFIDPRPVKEILASGEFDRILKAHTEAQSRGKMPR